MQDLVQYADRPFAFVWRYIRRRSVTHSVILLSVTAAVACSVGSQYGVKFLVDTLSAGPGASSKIWIAFALLAALVGGDNFLWRVAGWVSSFAFVAITGDIRADLFRHLTGHAPSYFADRLPGTLTSRVTATSNAIFIAENMGSWNVLPPCIATLGAVGLLISVSPEMAGVLSVVAIVMFYGLFKLAANGRDLHHAFAANAAEVDGEMMDIVGNLNLVRAFGGYDRERQRFARSMQNEMNARRRSLVYLERVRLAHALATAFLTTGLLVWAIMLWLHGQASSGDVVLVCTLGFTVLHSTRDLAVALVDVTQHLARLSEALSTLLVPHALPDRPDAKPLQIQRGAISFSGVNFRYPTSRTVLRGLDLNIAGGERVGLVGRSGCGKSTTLQLLQRLYEPQTGTITIDGQNIADVTHESLSGAVAIVSQDTSLFHRTILENIRYGRPDADDDEVMAAAEAALCRDFVEAMPEGFDSIVGDRGVKLSTGQRQRIAIARAFLKDAPILLLDEATSALDTESEALVRAGLDRLAVGRTVIAIAHRLSTLQNFDRIVVLEGGRVVQQGPPGKLIRGDSVLRSYSRREKTLNMADSAA